MCGDEQTHTQAAHLCVLLVQPNPNYVSNTHGRDGTAAGATLLGTGRVGSEEAQPLRDHLGEVERQRSALDALDDKVQVHESERRVFVIHQHWLGSSAFVRLQCLKLFKDAVNLSGNEETLAASPTPLSKLFKHS